MTADGRLTCAKEVAELPHLFTPQGGLGHPASRMPWQSVALGVVKEQTGERTEPLTAADIPPAKLAPTSRVGPRLRKRARLVQPRTERSGDFFTNLARDSQLPHWLWLVLVVGGLAMLITSAVGSGPDWLDRAGAGVVLTAYAGALSARLGGRPVVFAGLAAGLSAIACFLEFDWLRSGAAVAMVAVAAVFSVVGTVPTQRFFAAVRELLIATALGGVGAIAALGFEPNVDIDRFEIMCLLLALIGAVVAVYGLGAGLHGMGGRGLATIAAAAVLIGISIAYAEMLRRYGSADLVREIEDAVRWMRDNLGAVPRPTAALIGAPALLWGVHMRARRRQGWWLTAFGVCVTVPIANGLVTPDASLAEVGLSTVYGLAIGVLLGFVLIRADLAFTGPRGRRARQAEEAAAVRPEPRRTQPLL